MNEPSTVNFRHTTTPYTKYNRAVVSQHKTLPDIRRSQTEVGSPTEADIIKGFALKLDNQMTRPQRKRRTPKTAAKRVPKKKRKQSTKKKPPPKKKKTIRRKNIF